MSNHGQAGNRLFNMRDTYIPQVIFLRTQYVASYREFPSVMGFADTKQEAIDAAKESLDSLIKGYEAKGMELPEALPETDAI